MTDFERFEAACRMWIDRMGLGDWVIWIEERDLPREDESVNARVYFNWTQHTAKIFWNTAYRAPEIRLGPQSPEEIALHEVLHLVLVDLSETIARRQTTEGPEIDAAEHAVVRRLMRAFAATAAA